MACPRRLRLAPLGLTLALLLAACATPAERPDSLEAGAGRLVGNDKSEATVLRVADATRDGGDYANAINLYRRAHELEPKDPVPLARLGAAFAAQRAYNEAAESYKKALALAPDDLGSVRGLATVLLATDQPQLALSYLEPALKTHKDPRLYSLIGVADDLAGNYQAAQRSYAEGLRLAPGDASLSNNLGLSQALAGNYGEAVKTLEAVAAAPGATARTRQNLALAYGLAGETDKAAAVARRDLDEQSVKSNLAYYAMLRGLDQRARAAAIIGAHAPAHGTNADAAAMDTAQRASAAEPRGATAIHAADAVPAAAGMVESAPLSPPAAAPPAPITTSEKTTRPHRPIKTARAKTKPVAEAAPSTPNETAAPASDPSAAEAGKPAQLVATVAAPPAQPEEAAAPAAPKETAAEAGKPVPPEATASAASARTSAAAPTASKESAATAAEAAATDPGKPTQLVTPDSAVPAQSSAAPPVAAKEIAAALVPEASAAKAPDAGAPAKTADAAPAPASAPTPASPAAPAQVAAADAGAAAPAESGSISATAPTHKTRTYLVQVGAFHSPERAHKMCDALVAKGFGLAVSASRSTAAESWHFCRSASPLPKAEALAMAQRLHDEADSAAVLVPVSARSAATN